MNRKFIAAFTLTLLGGISADAQVQLKVVLRETMGARDQDSFVLMVNASKRDDYAGMQALIETQKVVALHAGTLIRIECGQELAPGRVESGAQIGNTLWVNCGFLGSKEEFKKLLDAQRQAEAKRRLTAVEKEKREEQRQKREELTKYLRSCDEEKQLPAASSMVSPKAREIILKTCEEVRNGKPLDLAKKEQAEALSKEEAVQDPNAEHQKLLRDCDRLEYDLSHQLRSYPTETEIKQCDAVGRKITKN